MKPPTRKQLRQAITDKGITSVLKVPKSAITHKQRRFVEALVLDEMTGADAYRAAYDTKASPKTVGDNASRLKADVRIQAEILALEQAKQVAALHTAEALRSLTISTLTSALIDPDVKMATKIQAAKILGQVTEVAAFTERKEITHVRDSGAIRDQIMAQLKTMMLASDDAETIDADSLLEELAGAEPHPEDCTYNEPTGDYQVKQRREARLFAEQIRRYYPEPDNGYIAVKAFPHDFGSYYEACAVFDDNDEAACNWAYTVESDPLAALREWDETARAELGLQPA